MNSTLRTALTAGGLALALLGAGCGSMSERDKATAIGAGVGGVAGAVLTDGPLGTVGGAAVGGVIGNQVGKHREDDD